MCSSVHEFTASPGKRLKLPLPTNFGWFIFSFFFFSRHYFIKLKALLISVSNLLLFFCQISHTRRLSWWFVITGHAEVMKNWTDRTKLWGECWWMAWIRWLRCRLLMAANPQRRGVIEDSQSNRGGLFKASAQLWCRLFIYLHLFQVQVKNSASSSFYEWLTPA